MGTGTWTTLAAIADVDADGDMDVMTTDGGHLSWQANDGTGSFGAAVPFADAFIAHAADLDHDGDADLLTAYDEAGAWLHESLGGGLFAAPVALPADDQVTELASGDFDGDGDLDVLSAS